MFSHEDLKDLYIDEPPLLIGARAKYPYSKELEIQFTRTSRFGDEYKMWERVGDYIYVPRNVCTPGPNTIDIRTEGFKCSFKSIIKARNDEQERIFDECEALLANCEDHILRAGTGIGKSVVGLEMATRINRPTLVVVPETTLMDQWYERAEQFLKIPKSRIGFIQQNRFDYKGKWLVIGMLNSLSLKEDYPRDMNDYFGLLIVDEIHKCGGDELSRVLGLFSAKRRFGLSATPDRSDGKELLIQAHVGPIRVVSDAAPLEFKVMKWESSWPCPRRKVVEYGYESYEKIDHTPARCGHIINSIAKHTVTNGKIATWVKKAYDKDRYIIVFSDRLQQLDDLMALCARKGVPGHEMHKYIGGLTKEQIKKAKSKRVIFGTYQKLGTGVDVPWFDTCILASPRANIKQFVGRILREHPDKKTPVVFDIGFSDSPVFKKYGIAKMKYYESVGAPVKIIK